MNEAICKHCKHKIWLVFIGTIFEGWRDIFGNICNDDYRHMPQRAKS